MIKSIGIVTFDLKIGQKVENNYPFNSLSNKEKDIISSLAIPENTINKSELSINYHFNYFYGKRNFEEKYFCYCLFKQKKDLKLERSYFQKTIFLLTTNYNPIVYRETLESLYDIIDNNNFMLIFESAFEMIKRSRK